MEVDTTEDLHGIVLNSAFKAMISNPSTVLVNTGDNLELSLNRNVLILFSPLIRNILGSVPCCTTPTLYLPDITTMTIIKLRDILNKGISGNFWDVKESGGVLEAASALGIDMTRLHYGAERQSTPSGEILVNIDNIGNKSRQMKKVFDQKKIDGKEIVFISKSKVKKSNDNVADNKNPDVGKETSSENPARGKNPAVDPAQKATTAQVEKTHPNLASFSTSSSQDPVSSSINTQASVQIKKEVHAMEDTPNGLEEPMEQLPTNSPVNSIITSSMTTDTEDLKNQCEKCKKAFASMTLLRYHYCSHFRGILKKKFANLFHDNKCLECAKTFPNHGRLLLHIGVQHDKINEILKSKGIAELPPYSATAAAHGGLDPPSEAEAAQQDAEAAGDDMENLDNQTSATSTRDVKNVPLFSALSAKPDAIRPSLVVKTTNEIQTSTNLPKSSSLTSSLNDSIKSTSSNSASAPTNPDTSLDKNNDSTAECNYELECQVCDQKLKTISLLEQHCCRHFMKDLQDQYSSLMDGLKCNICYNSFKQKHSLLLHIGCKHGKINDILRQKNYAALPCPVTNTTSAAMQKQLVQIKKERLESVDMKEEHFNNVRNEMAQDRPVREASTDLLDETPPVPEDTSAPMPTLDEILKKYKFSAGSGPK